MKNKNRFLFPTLLTVGLASLTGVASADVTKANNGTALNLGGSYVGGVPPTGSDTLIVDATMSADQTAALGGNLSVAGITYSSSKILTINNTASSALTIGTGGITMSGGGRLTFNNAVTLGGNQTWGLGTARINLYGDLTTGGNTLNISAANATSGTISIQGNKTFGSEVTFGTMQNLWINSGTINFDGTNNTNTNFSLFGGTANIASMGNVGDASSIGKGSANVRAQSILNYTGNTASSNKGMVRDTNGGGTLGDTTVKVTTVGQTLTMSGNFTHFGTTQSGNWIFGGAGNLTLSGQIQNGVSTGVTKNDGGTLTLSNASSTYAGQTRINGGKLTIASTGNINSTSDVLIAGGEFNYNASTALTKAVTFSGTGGTLSGSGTISQAVNVTTGNTLAIGNSPGQINFGSTLGLNGTTVMEIDGVAGAGVTGGHDFANVTGVVTYGGALTLDMGDIFTTGSYSWNLFDFAGETGTFSTVTLTDQYSGSLLDGDLNGVWDLTSGDNTWQFTESTGVLGLTVVPEPNAAALLGGLGVLCLLRRRRTA